METMKLHLTQSEDNNLITGYGDDYIEVNKKRYQQTVVVMANSLTLDWSAQSFDTLTAAHFEALLAFQPDVVLLGTGKKHCFVHPKLTVQLTEKNIAVECMTTDAACRTYNILMNEGRHVAAALLLE